MWNGARGNCLNVPRLDLMLPHVKSDGCSRQQAYLHTLFSDGASVGSGMELGEWNGARGVEAGILFYALNIK